MAHKPETIKRVQAQIAETTSRYTFDSPTEAAFLLRRVKAECIADDLADGAKQWAERIEEYRYLRDLCDAADKALADKAAE
jgi:hypothetical protein